MKERGLTFGRSFLCSVGTASRTTSNSACRALHLLRTDQRRALVGEQVHGHLGGGHFDNAVDKNNSAKNIFLLYPSTLIINNVGTASI
jgi:hypothetical protein